MSKDSPTPIGAPEFEVPNNPTITLNGIEHDFESVSKLHGKDADKIFSEGLARKAGIAKRDKIRAAITKNVGDPQAILGTTADVTQLNAAAVLALISAFKTGDTFSKFRGTFMATIEALVPPADGADVYTQAQQFLAGVQSGDIVLTAALKGLPEVLGEMAGRSTGVAAILAQAKAAKD